MAVVGAVPITQFTPAQQAALRRGEQVGKYQILNGHVMDLTTNEGQALQHQRVVDQNNAAMAKNGGHPTTQLVSGPGGYQTARPIAAPIGPGAVQPATPGVTDSAPVTQAPDDPTDAAAKDAKAASDRDALALIRSTLAQYGLPDSLADWAWGEIVAGKGNAEIMLDLRNRPEFKAEFPEIDMINEANKKGARIAPPSPGDIVSYRNNARQIMRAAGLPEGFYDSKEDFTKFIVGGVSAAELASRVDLARNAAFNAPPEVKSALAEWGVGPGDLTAFWLDPDVAQPLLERKYAAAQIAGASKRTGFGSLSEGEATGLTQLGVSADQAQSGFGQLAGSKELFGALDNSDETFGRTEQMDAVFGGNANAARRIEQQRRRRKARYEEGGSFAAGQGGVAGLGSAPRT